MEVVLKTVGPFDRTACCMIHNMLMQQPSYVTLVAKKILGHSIELPVSTIHDSSTLLPILVNRSPPCIREEWVGKRRDLRDTRRHRRRAHRCRDGHEDDDVREVLAFGKRGEAGIDARTMTGRFERHRG